MLESIETVRQEIMQAIEDDELVLPTMPEVALRVKEAAEDENATAPSISRVIGNDAALSARIIKVANSPLVRGVTTVEDLQMAISRIGIPYACNLAIGIAMEQLFQATNDAVDERMRRSWEHSTEVASLSHVLCQHFTKLRPDQATLAGLVHEIGKLPILMWADSHDWDGATIDAIIEELHPEVGRKILEEWDFPEEIRDVPLRYTEFQRTPEDTDYVDVVMVANLHTYAGTEHQFARMDWGGIPAFDNLGIDVDIILAQEEDLSEDIATARELLH